ncbi:MAG TPA: hypothetical protein VFB65_01430 [Pyrinomonadaceae bacterium]|nr:hypothetical protein [Pyrinomonadaceae bacterium]
MFRRLLVLLFVVSLAATPTASFQKKTKPAKEKAEEVDAEAEQQRTVAISLVTTLADEARSFKDLTRRARVQARAADVLWDTDPERARELFRRAWEAAENVDDEAARQRSEEIKRMEAGGGPVVLRGGADLRSEVLRLVAKRDYKLSGEFLKALEEDNAKSNEEAAAAARRRGGPMDQLGASKRLQLARRLLDDGDVERAMTFARESLDKVNLDTIFFLSALREKDAALADKLFEILLGHVSRDPLADANTVSRLSSYVLTPFLYIVFEPSGGGNQNRSRGPQPPPDIHPAVRSQFLKVAFQILMQPSPPADQDRTTSGVRGKYMVIKRLLPIFEQHAPDLAPSLRTQMTALASYVPQNLQQGENRALTVGIAPEDAESDPYQRMQERLDKATRSEDRDAIYADYAVSLTGKGDSRARDLVDKIENSELRKSVKAYTDFQLVQLAVRKKDAAEAARLAKDGELTSIQRVWAYTSAAKLVATSERSRALDLLNEALAESRRISNSDPDRARALTAVAANLADLDLVRAWEILGEVVKAANAAEGFTGEDSRISSRLQTPMMVVMTNSTAEDFDLLAVFNHLARADLLRAVQLAKTFTGEAPRAVATLAISRSILEKRKQG